ncbi:MAG: D-tyrosyl-tRNA(Tyr) deacylase [Phycisphaerae bacterium]|nr:D-tyrosyl-tRNA(Tyr) deacylase [Phycisphaerae bacterium]
MRAVLQRVSQAYVEADGRITGRIGRGLLVLLGVGKQDTSNDVDWMADKIVGLRIFADENDRMNLSVADIRGGILLISQFTLYGNCRKGKRPSFDAAADPETANRLYEYAIQRIGATGVDVQTGIFAASMQITCTNEGPVTLIIDSKTPGSVG